MPGCAIRSNSFPESCKHARLYHIRTMHVWEAFYSYGRLLKPSDDRQIGSTFWVQVLFSLIDWNKSITHKVTQISAQMRLALIALLSFLTSFESNTVSFDFGTMQDGTSWRAINDGVMGGLSRGLLSVTDSSLVFSGQLSFANNGGFTSFRAPFGTYDLSKASQVRIRYRSEGTTFALMLEPTDVFYFPHYRLPLPGTDGAWSEVSLPVSDIRQYRLNSERPGEIESEELRKLIRIGFISSDKNTDPFTFEIDFLTFQ